MKRQLVLLSGDHDWCLSTLDHYRTRFGSHRISRVKEGEASILGQETDVLVLNAYEGLNPDLLGQAIGALRGGGLFFILAPNHSTWPDNPDPFLKKIQAAYSPPIQHSRFIARFSRLVNTSPDVIRINQGEKFPILELKPRKLTSEIAPNTEQQAAIDAVKHVISGHRRRPAVLISDRGRGKSAAFGIAAAQLIKSGLKSIIITAPSAESVASVFNHAALELENSCHGKGLISYEDAEVRYVAPDILLRSDFKPELVLVDEAAAIPAELLQQLLDKFPRIAFATTVHGYEGTGQGFAIRFSSYLDKNTRGWRRILLSEPVRWEKEDPLEKLAFDLLLMNVDPGSIDSSKNAVSPEQCKIEVIPQDELLSNESMLREMFGLLVLAHYRTRPFDLRYLLDASSLTIYVMKDGEHVVGVALVNHEGGLDREIAQTIAEGMTRPHGHLLPEILASHCGLPDAAVKHCARVMRIAIHPALQKQGLGSTLLDFIVKHEQSNNIDYIGSSFGATASLLCFWKKAGFHAVKVGVNRGASSGEHSITVFNVLSDNSRHLTETAKVQFDAQFNHELADAYKYLNPALVKEVLVHTNPNILQSITQQDWFDIETFWKHKRMYESCSAPLSRLVVYGLSQRHICEYLSDDEIALLVSRILQQRSWSEVAHLTGATGRKEMLHRLRKTIKKIVRLYSSNA